MLTISSKLAQNGLECHLNRTKIQNFLSWGSMLPDPLAWVAFITELFSEIIEISNSIHKTCQELGIKFFLTTFNFAPMSLYNSWRFIYMMFKVLYCLKLWPGHSFLSSNFSPQPLSKTGDYTRPTFISWSSESKFFRQWILMVAGDTLVTDWVVIVHH